MDDEHGQREVDERVRAVFAPEEAASAQVVSRALASGADAAPRGRLIGVVAVLLAVFCAAAIGVVVASRSGGGAPAFMQPAALAITGRGAVLVVETADGRRWIVGPPPTAGAGSYIIVIPQ